jgi:hypothetical protein
MKTIKAVMTALILVTALGAVSFSDQSSLPRTRLIKFRTNGTARKN